MTELLLLIMEAELPFGIPKQELGNVINRSMETIILSDQLTGNQIGNSFPETALFTVFIKPLLND